MDVNSARYLVSALIQATVISWSVVLVILTFLRQRNHDILKSTRERKKKLQDDLDDLPLRIAELEKARNSLRQDLHATRMAKQPTGDLEERLSNIQASLEGKEEELKLEDALATADMSFIKASIDKMLDSFQTLRIVSVCTFLTVLIGILSMSLLEDSSVFGVSYETASVFLTLVFSASTFLLLCFITLNLLVVDSTDFVAA